MFLHRLLEGTPRGSLYRRFKVKMSDLEQRWMAWKAHGPNGTGWHGERWVPHHHFFIPGCFLCKNIHARKILDQFEFWKVPETSKYTK
jgi:hypothetical protein